MFNDTEVVEDEAMFDTRLCISNVAKILVLLFECEWFGATLVFDFEWLDATLKFIFDCKWITSMKGGWLAFGIFESLLVRNMITSDMEGRNVADACVQRRAM